MNPPEGAGDLDTERVYDIYEDLLDLARSGVAAAAILGTLLNRVSMGDATHEEARQGLEEALAELEWRPQAKVLKEVRRKLK